MRRDVSEHNGLWGAPSAPAYEGLWGGSLAAAATAPTRLIHHRPWYSWSTLILTLIIAILTLILVILALLPLMRTDISAIWHFDTTPKAEIPTAQPPPISPQRSTDPAQQPSYAPQRSTAIPDAPPLPPPRVAPAATPPDRTQSRAIPATKSAGESVRLQQMDDRAVRKSIERIMGQGRQP